MRSLRARLTASVIAALALVLVLFSLLIDRAFARATQRLLDERLESDASAIAGMVEGNPDGTAELEYGRLPAFEPGPRAAYFEVWLADGTLLAHSPSLADGVHLPRPRGPDTTFTSPPLPDGRRGRLLAVARVPRPADPPRPGASPLPPVTVVVALGTEEIAAAAARLRVWLLALAAVALLAGAGAARLAVTRGLRPAERLAADIGRLDEKGLGRALEGGGVPRELEPVVARLNDLLARIDQALSREKRFSADVAHELRTPLAGLRSILEVAASRERVASEYREALAEAHAVVLPLGGLVENLLTLARLEAETGARRADRVLLREVVEAAWAPRRERAARRRLSFADELETAAEMQTDEAKLRLVVANLLDNAVDYTAEGGAIRVRARPEDGVLLEVWDSGPKVPEEALPRLFDRFFRVDAARSDGAHCGIGLTLVRSLCDALGLSVSAHNGGDGSVRFELRAQAR